MEKFIKKYDEILSQIKRIVPEPYFDTDIIPALKQIANEGEPYGLYDFLKHLESCLIEGWGCAYNDILELWKIYNLAYDFANKGCI